MAKISELFPEYARLADGLRTGAIPSTPENEAAHDREQAKAITHKGGQLPKVTLRQNGWATVPVAAACWSGDALDVERCS
jgi:hypothetical protein